MTAFSAQFRGESVLCVTFESLEIIAPEGSRWLAAYQHGAMQTCDFSSRDKSKKRYIYIGPTNGRVRIFFELSEKMPKNMFN